jgi:hypothetical protein
MLYAEGQRMYGKPDLTPASVSLGRGWTSPTWTISGAFAIAIESRR